MTGRMPHQFRALLLAVWLLVTMMGGARADEAVTYGADGSPPIILMVSISPTILDTHGYPQPVLGRWLAHIADKARVRLLIRPHTGSGPLEDLMREADTCSLGYARLPAREQTVHWLFEVKRDRLVFVTRQADPFVGSLTALLPQISGQLGAPSGLYRTILDNRGIRYVVINDQRQLARMVGSGDPRFGLLIGGSLSTPEIRSLNLRVVAELPEVGTWLACSRTMPEDVRRRLEMVLRTQQARQLHREALSALLPGTAGDP